MRRLARSQTSFDLAPARAERDGRRANSLDGTAWTKYSISVWSDIRKTDEERTLRHPALFPMQLVNRVIDCFMPPDGSVVLDPFAGTGAVPVAADRRGLTGIGVEIASEYAEIARQRLTNRGMFDGTPSASRIIEADAGSMTSYLERSSVDLVFTSPPYWDILSQKRTADQREIRDYAGAAGDLSRVTSYTDFLTLLTSVFSQVHQVMKFGAYCVVNVMDIRKGDRFYPLHSDVAERMAAIGFKFDDLIIWDRRSDYNNFRALGFPAVFRVNKAHEYLLIFIKQ